MKIAKQIAARLAKRKASASDEDGDEDSYSLETCAEEILAAVGKKDAKALARALKKTYTLAGE